MLPTRSKSRITRAGMLYERRLVALRRLDAQRWKGIRPRPSALETHEAQQRWLALKHQL